MRGGLAALAEHARTEVLRGLPDAAARSLRAADRSLRRDDPDRQVLVADLALAEVMRSRFAVARDLGTEVLASVRGGDVLGAAAARALGAAMTGPEGTGAAGPGQDPAAPPDPPAAPDAAAHDPAAALDDAVAACDDGQALRCPIGLYLVAEAAMSGGRLCLAEQVARRGLALHDGSPGARGVDLLLRQALARSLVFQARLEEARDHVDALERDAEAAGATLVAVLARGIEAFVAAQARDRAALRRAVAAALAGAVPPHRSYFHAGTWTLCAYALAADGQGFAATEVLLLGAGGPDLPRVQWVDRAYGYELLARAAVDAGDLPAAQAWLARAGRVAGGGMATAALDRTQALVRTAQGRGAEAVAAAARAESGARGFGGDLDATRAQVLRASALGRSGSRADAVAVLQDAAEHAAAFGGTRIRADAVRELRRLGRRLRPAATGWEQLTSREREVAVLVADGLTDRQVSRLLQVSVRTVQSHLGTVLRTLAVPSRAGLPAVVPRAAVPAQRRAPLTPRQHEVVALVARGWSNRRIAEQLAVSPKTVEKHVGDALVRWAVPSRTALSACWVAQGEAG